jgi:hypothetical protein
MIKRLSIILLSSLFINVYADCIQDTTFNIWWTTYKDKVEMALFGPKEAQVQAALRQAEADQRTLQKLNNTLDKILSSF